MVYMAKEPGKLKFWKELQALKEHENSREKFYWEKEKSVEPKHKWEPRSITIASQLTPLKRIISNMQRKRLSFQMAGWSIIKKEEEN